MKRTDIDSEYRKMAVNFMTPHVKDMVRTPDGRIVELSVGEGIKGEKIWGVSEFVLEKGKITTTRRGQMKTTLRDARIYFNTLIQSV